MAKYKNQKCIHCLTYHNKLTEDHIFPRSWYPKSTLPNTEKWTVPSCEKCNKKLGKAEEELFNRLAICLDRNDLPASGLSEKFLNNLSPFQKDERKVGRAKKLLLETVKNFISYPYEDDNESVLEGGTPKDGVRSRLMIRIPTDKLLLVGEKIIRGLEFKIRNRLIENDRDLYVVAVKANNKKILELVNNWEKLLVATEKNVCRGPGFIMRYGINPVDDNWILYNVKIWNHLNIWAMIYPKDKKTNKAPADFVRSKEYFNESIRLFNQKRFEDSLKAINISIDLNPNDFSAQHTRSSILLKLNKYESALEAINKAIELNPDNLQSLSDKVAILYFLEKYEESTALANEALKLNPNDYVLWHRKEIALYHSQKFEESIKAFDESLRITPYFSIALGKKISALILIGKLEDAVKLFEESDLSEIDYEKSLNNIGFAYLELERFSGAEKYLNEARIKDKKEKSVYYNLYRLNLKTKHYKFFLLFFLKFKFLMYREKIVNLINWVKSNIFKKSLEKKRIDNSGRPDIFRGPGRLFSSNPQTRETVAILKILRTPYLWALCNDWLRWVAINIPLDLLGKNGFEGDIDIIVAMPAELPPKDDLKNKYRTFEVKSITVDKNGNIKSLGGGKHKKLLSQLKKLKNFGCGQIFLSEIYVMERGYSSRNAGLPIKVVEKGKEKSMLLQDKDFGYVLMLDEPVLTHDDESGGAFSMPINVLPTKENIVKSPFRELSEYLNGFYKSEKEKSENFGFPPAIYYCKKCKKLSMIEINRRSIKCKHCNKSIT